MAAALRYIETLPRDEQKSPNGFLSIENGASNVSLRVFVDEPNYIAGLFGKRRIQGLPLMENSSGLIYRMSTSEERDGPYEGAHFVYFAKERKLLLERSQYTPRKTILQDFVADKVSSHTTVHIDNTFFKPIVRNDFSDFLTRYGEATEVAIDVDRDYLEEVKEYDGNLGSMLESLKEVMPESQQLRFGGSVSRFQKVGGMNDAKNFVVNFLSNVPEAVKKATARVKVESERKGKAISINLLSKESGYPVVVPMDENRVVNSAEMWGLMLNLFERIQAGEEIDDEVSESANGEVSEENSNEAT